MFGSTSVYHAPSTRVTKVIFIKMDTLVGKEICSGAVIIELDAQEVVMDTCSSLSLGRRKLWPIIQDIKDLMLSC